MESYNEKCKTLLEKIDEYTNQDIIIAFSGGVDSSLLLKLACDSAKIKEHKVYAVTIQSELHPIKDIKIAENVAKEIGAIHYIIKANELEEAGIINNPKERCYLCKKYLFKKLKEFSLNLKLNIIIEGTNQDDLYMYRPGLKAIKELEIISPLANSKMTKEDVRAFAKQKGISVAERPSTPCLATRFPYNTILSYEQMKNVDKGENYIKTIGIRNVRMRVYNDLVRIEVDKEEISKLINHKEEIVSYIRNLGYNFVTVDLNGFHSGSMDCEIVKNKKDKEILS